jgi:hypothetical protein
MYRETKELPITVNPTRTGRWHDLADSIRLGCKKVPRQAFGRPALWDGQVKYATCAVQAGEDGGYSFSTALLLRATCPACGEWHPQVIPFLNDRHLWTRERIADWLDTL